jgi:hypothetical protein
MAKMNKATQSTRKIRAVRSESGRSRAGGRKEWSDIDLLRTHGPPTDSLQAHRSRTLLNR